MAWRCSESVDARSSHAISHLPERECPVRLVLQAGLIMIEIARLIPHFGGGSGFAYPVFDQRLYRNTLECQLVLVVAKRLLSPMPLFGSCAM